MEETPYPKVADLACTPPEKLHPLCSALVERFQEGLTTVMSPAYACNMVDSATIPFVECLLKIYADGYLDKSFL